MTRPTTREVPPAHRAAWLQDYRTLPPEQPWWRRVWARIVRFVDGGMG